MILKELRGFRHMLKNVGDLSITKLLGVSSSGNQIFFINAIKDDDKIYLVQNNYGHCFEDYNMSSINPKVLTLIKNSNNIGRRIFVLTDKSGVLFGMIKFFLVDKNYEEEINSIISQNKKLLSNVINRYCGNNYASVTFFANYAKNSPNLILWCLTNFYKYNVSSFPLLQIINWFNAYGKTNCGKLKKGTITAYNGLDGISNLTQECVTIRMSCRIKSIINTFNTAQKRILNSYKIGKREEKIINRFAALSNSKKKNFIQKMSTIEDASEILRQMAFLTKEHFYWNRESLLESLSTQGDFSFSIIFDENNILLIKVDTYDTIKYLAKSTNWCISKNKSYWNNYIECRGSDCKQYMIFDFNRKEDDELSIVGFTVEDNTTIVNAHSFTNKNLINGQNSSIDPFSLKKCWRKVLSISNILSNDGIDEKFYSEKKEAKYEWNEESFISLAEAKCKDNYEIIYRKDNKIVISIPHNKLVEFVDCDGFDRFSCEDYGSFMSSFSKISKVFIFSDFNKPIDTGLNYSIISFNRTNCVEHASEVFNYYCKKSRYNFNRLCEQFSLPYNIICRVDDKISRFISYLKDFNLNMIKELIKDNEIKKEILNNENERIKNALFTAIQVSLYDVCTPDFIEILYKNGITLSEAIGNNSFCHLLSDFTCKLMRCRTRFGIPSKYEIEKLFNGEYDESLSHILAYFYLYDLIISNESSIAALESISKYLIHLTSNAQCQKIIVYLSEKLFAQLGERTVSINSQIKIFSDELNKHGININSKAFRVDSTISEVETKNDYHLEIEPHFV